MDVGCNLRYSVVRVWFIPVGSGGYLGNVMGHSRFWTTWTDDYPLKIRLFFGIDIITKIRYIITMKGTRHSLKTLFILFSCVSLTACSVPFANGVTGKDFIKIANAGKNIKNITQEGVAEELITETKNVLRDIQAGGKTQR